MQRLATRRSVLKRAAALGAASVLGNMDRVLGRDSKRPNILFLLTDNQRYDAVGYLNKAVRTPNLDRLAKDGVRFRNTFVTTSICCASRASILTGTYARRHNVWDFETKLPPSLQKNSYPFLLRNAGYRTGFFGKYGVGKVSNQKGDGAPFREDDLPAQDKAGFDVIEDTGFAYYASGDAERKHHNNEILAEKAERFIGTAPKDQPFCLSISFHAPHESSLDEGYRAEPDMLALYARDTLTPGPLVNEAALNSLPPFLQNSEARRRQQLWYPDREKWVNSARNNYALITGIDRSIGRMVAALEKKGVADNTVIMFTSDNGQLLGDYGLEGIWYGYEGSIRIPLMIRPVTRPKGQDVEAPVLNIDFAPTMLALAGVPIPAVMQGRDVSPLWTGARLARPWRTDFLYEHYLTGLHPSEEKKEWTEKFIPSSEGVRNERYTYLRYPHQKGENESLFDRVADPNELKNIIHTAPPQLVEQLRKRTDELIAQNS